MSTLAREQLEAIRLKIYAGEYGLISTLTPDMFFAMLSNSHDDGFLIGKESTQKEFVCLLVASGMSSDEISTILNMDIDVVENIIETKKAHVGKCVKKLERRRSK